MCEYTAGDFKTWNDVVAALDARSGVITCTMEALRDIDGYGRLGGNVRENIARKLGTMGVGTIRTDLPREAADMVVLIRQGTPVSELLEMIEVAMAGGGSYQDTADKLRRLNSVPDPNSLKAVVDVAYSSLQAAELMLLAAGPLPESAEAHTVSESVNAVPTQ